MPVIVWIWYMVSDEIRKKEPIPSGRHDRNSGVMLTTANVPARNAATCVEGSGRTTQHTFPARYAMRRRSPKTLHGPHQR